MEQPAYTVVVAEDEELLLHNLVEKIHRTGLGFHVAATAQTGLQAYEAVKEHNPDLLVTDIRMPVMNGIELLEKVRNHYPLTRFIITSGFSDFEYAKSAIRLRVCEYLLKPIDPEELRTALLEIRSQFEVERSEYSDIFNDEMTRNPPERIAEVLNDYLIHNYNININLNLIAANMNYSSSYLTKIYQQKYDTTPSKFITSLRMSHARQYLLHNPELSIKQIGELVGYHDQGYFSRTFKKQTGLSPFDFRESPMPGAKA